MNMGSSCHYVELYIYYVNIFVVNGGPYVFIFFCLRKEQIESICIIDLC